MISIFSSERICGQNNINGIVKNYQNSIPIPFVSILCENKLVFITNEKGQFSLNIHDSLMGKEINFSCIGFKEETIKIYSLNKSDSNIILLNEHTYILEEVAIETSHTTKFKIVKTGSRKKNTNGYIFSLAGSSEALYFPNDRHYRGFIKNVGFFITDKGLPKSKFRIRIYGADESLKPAKQILQQNLIACNNHNGNNWFDVDIENYRIRIPEYGFFVAMEWLPVYIDSSLTLKISDSNNETMSIKYNGQVLGGTSEFKENLTWYINANGTYSKMQRPDNVKYLNYFNPMIRASLKIYKNN